MEKLIVASVLLLGLLLSSCAPADKREPEPAEAETPVAPELTTTTPPAALYAPDEVIDLGEYGGGVVAITDAGVYELTGELADGGIVVTADGVTLILDGADINCTNAPAIACEAGNLTIELRGENYLTATAQNAVQSVNDLTVHGSGSVDVSAEETALQAGKTLTISGGRVNIVNSRNAIESENVLITKGSVSLVSRENGVIGDSTLDISGGEITASANVYGLRSNGSLNVSGGKIISLHSVPDSEAFYLDGKIALTGGTIIVGGACPDISDISTQSFINFTDNIAAGTEIEVYPIGETPNGDRLLATYSAERDIDALKLSAPGIARGASYDIYLNGEFAETIIA
ncbi:MAG: carbohydrate-binding domain-containing protein [Oscillospiraceae bacterium]|jgi:hypothetical protein|nr:carbohydrate-binding domain-containing protein [Oscillospiraceae bacterium]